MQRQGAVPAHVLEAFGLEQAEIEVLSGGRTNRTLRARAGADLVVQHLRASGHRDLLGVMENLVRVTAHLDWKHRLGHHAGGGHPEGGDRQGGSGAQADAGDDGTWWPQLIPTVAGRPFIMTPEGDVWRAYLYRPGRIARDALSIEALESAAALFGRFSRQTADLDGPPLIATEPRFHDLDDVWMTFHELVDSASADSAQGDRLAPLHDEIAELSALRDRIVERGRSDGLDRVPHRVVHNDTKISNALFDDTADRAIAVLDLDLVMMGPIWHDIGDLLRSAAWHWAPHAPRFEPALFERLVSAFSQGASDSIADDELVTAAVAGPRLAFELGIRYLADHLRPEPVLRVSEPDSHLHRGFANVKLATEMLRAYDALRSMVDALIAAR